jgi:hypothetical protein
VLKWGSVILDLWKKKKQNEANESVSVPAVQPTEQPLPVKETSY